MKVEFFIISEGAYNHDGSFTIVNTLDILKANTFPFKTNIGISMKLAINKECKWEKTFKFNLYKENEDKEVYSLGGNLPEKQNGVSKLALAANIQGIVIPSAGKYKMVLYLGDTPKAEYDFNVVENEKK